MKATSPLPPVLHRFKTLFRARDGQRLHARIQADATTSVVCGFCSTGCGLNIHLREGRAVGLTPAADYPVNRGSACPKGWEALTVLEADDRATVPLLRGADGRRRPVDWQAALETMVGRFRQIQAEHGPDALAFLSTGQIATEEMAFLGALTKFGMGIVHGDGNTRQCMATAVVAYKQAFGFDAPPYTYQDLEESDCIVLVGANPCIAHPILWERVMRNRHRPDIIVIDPRRTETAMGATLHLSIRPKTDLVLLYGLANLLIRNGGMNREFIDEHTTGFDEFAAFVRRFGVAGVAYETGLSVATLHDLAARIQQRSRVSFWWTMGVNQSHQGVRTAQALINLALLTGNIGRPGTGANSITGQCNAMGSRLFSNTTNLLGGHDFANPEHREKVARVLNIPVGRIPERAGWAYDQIVEGIEAGKIKGLWVIATNPAHSWIDQGRLRALLGKLDFLVVQDMYHSTETARVADLVLPAAAWGEKEGTFVNSERRVGLIKKVRRAPGLALSDFNIFKAVAHAYGCGKMFAGWDSPEAVFQVLKRLSAGQPCDISGIDDYRMLDRARGIQWPYPREDPDPTPQRRLFADGRFHHPDGRARFLFGDPEPLPEAPDDEFPFLLITGRGGVAQWHTQTRTAKSDVLRRLYPRELHVEINPADAEALGVRPEQEISVESRRGRLRARAFVSPTVRRGQLFLPMHDAATNRLTLAAFDPLSRQPAYKACAVRARPVTDREEGAGASTPTRAAIFVGWAPPTTPPGKRMVGGAHPTKTPLRSRFASGGLAFLILNLSKAWAGERKKVGPTSVGPGTLLG